MAAAKSARDLVRRSAVVSSDGTKDLVVCLGPRLRTKIFGGAQNDSGLELRYWPVQSWTAVRSSATTERLSSRIPTISSTWSRLTISGGAYNRWSPAPPSTVPAPGYET